MNLRITYLIIICLLWKGASQGQNFSHVRHYTTDNGLPHNVGYNLMQDRQGFLWVCTDDGLARFDGSQFKVYRSKDGLLSNYPIDIAEAEDGTLWIGTWKGGVNCLKNDSIYTPDLDVSLFRVANLGVQGDRLMLSGEKSRALFYEKKGSAWKLLNPLKNIYLFLKNDSTIEYGQEQAYVNDASLRPLFFHRSYLTYDQSMLVFAGLAGVWKYQNDATLTAFFPDIIKKDTIYDVSQDAQERYWLGGHGKIWRIDTNGQAKIWTKHLPPKNIFNLRHGRDGKIYFLTGLKDLRQRGIYAYDPKTEQLEDLKQKYNLKTFPSYLTIDQEGNVWFTTNGDGLYCITYSPFKNYDQKQGLANSFVKDLIQDKHGDMYVGTLNGLYRLQPPGFSHIPLLAKETTAQIADLYLDSKGNLRAFVNSLYARSHHIFAVDRQRAQPISHLFKHKFLDHRYQYWNFKDNDLRVSPLTTIGQSEGGRIYKFARDFLIHQLLEYQGKYWMATNQGLYAFKEVKSSTDTTIQFLDSLQVANGLPSNFVNTVAQGHQGELWIGTKEGLSKLYKGKITNYTTQNGLVSNTCNCILIDHRGEVWVGTPLGLSHFNGQRFVNYDHKSGLVSPGVSCLFLDKQQQLWIGTNKGVSVLDISQPAQLVVPPRLYLEKLLVDRNPVKPGAELTLAYNQGLEIRFQALSFIHPEGIRYQYRLDGEPWQDTRLNFIKYNRFSTGNHSLEIRARKFNSAWSVPQKIDFEVRSPIWWRSWAIIGYLIVVVLLMNWMIRRRSKKLEKEKTHLEKVVAERTQTLEHQKTEIATQAEQLKEMDQVKSRFFANISHEFKTPLTLIMGPAEKLLGLKEQPFKTYSEYVVANAQRLAKLINQLMDVSKLDSGKMALQMTSGDVAAFLRQIFYSFELLGQQKNIQLILKMGQEMLIGSFDEDKVEKICFNLLSNALKFTPAQGQITFALEKLEKQIKITISDNGVGIAPDQLPFVFDRFYQADDSGTRAHEGTGIGLALVKELVTLYEGTIEVESRPNQVTTFTVYLPFVATNDTLLEPPTSPKEPEVGPNNTDADIAVVPAPDITTVKTAHNTILIVEDNSEIRNFVAAELAPFYELLLAENGAEGITLAQNKVPDLIITDIMMPQVDGFELVKTLREDEVTSHIPMVILSAKNDFESKITGLEMGSDDYLTKPFSAKELLLRVKNRLDYRDKIRQAFAQQVSSLEQVSEPLPKPLSGREKAFLKKATDIVEKNLDDPELDITRFCQEIGMSHSSLFRKLKALTDMSIVEFIRSIRLKHAAMLLRETDEKVETISIQVGFGYVNYFNKCFKQQFKVSPSEYRSKSS